MNRKRQMEVHPDLEELECCLEALIPDLNLRLLMEREVLEEPDVWDTLFLPERMLLVEQITVIRYKPGRKKKLSERIRQAGRRIANCLMEYAGNFLQKILK